MARTSQPYDGKHRRVISVIRFLPPVGILTGATGFASMAVAQGLHAAVPVIIALGALIPAGVLIIMVSIPLVLAFGGETVSRGPGEEDDGGGGGGGRPPKGPDDPPWWPSFEREFRRYAGRHPERTPVA
ncbi:MAG TPA: hypothetical protein VE152_07555 [Acidimicrobiales bacterium]|nr:hypothetical protein [Acidimicrobiales bacterium]